MPHPPETDTRRWQHPGGCPVSHRISRPAAIVAALALAVVASPVAAATTPWSECSSLAGRPGRGCLRRRQQGRPRSRASSSATCIRSSLPADVRPKVCATEDEKVCDRGRRHGPDRRHSLHHRPHQRPRLDRAQVITENRTSRQGQGPRRSTLADTPAVDVLTQDGAAKSWTSCLPGRNRLPRARSRLVRPQGLRQRRQHGLPARPGRARPAGRPRVQRVRRGLARG